VCVCVLRLLLLQNSNPFITHTMAILYYMMYYYLQYGYTPIHLASNDGHVQVVEKLISSGADVNVVNKVSVNRVCVNYYYYTL